MSHTNAEPATLTHPNWQMLTPHACELGESPFWHPQEQRLYWVDIPGRQVLRMVPGADAPEVWDLPGEPGCIAPAAGGGWVMALRQGVFRARTWGGPLELIATLDYDTRHMRANDGKCDALGRFWVGTLDETKLARNATLSSIDARGQNPLIQRHTDPATLPVTTANGLAWSPDGRTLYWADTASHRVDAWDFDANSNTLCARRTFQQFAPKPQDWQFDPAPDNGGYRGRPDGAAVDVQGNYWVAMFEGRRICKIATDGTLLAELATPVQCPTMPCFGGDDLQTLFITSARHHRSAAELAAFPGSGCTFTLRMDVPGLPVNVFQD
jgi:sugar lactone lactonase YvrE